MNGVTSRRPLRGVGRWQALAWLMGAVMSILGAGAAAAAVTAAASAHVDPRGVAHLPALGVPPSRFMSPQARREFIRLFGHPADAPPINGNIALIRAYYGRFNSALVARARRLYPVSITREVMNGVRTEVIEPRAGVAAQNRNRVLINLHGGAFLWGAGSGGEIESIPIAGVGRIKVVTVDYREGPEYKFPAASEDVAAVYRALLRRYRPRDIGIYGCSAGGILTAESVAWFEKAGLPIPGAIGTFCSSASEFGGDSAYLAFALTGQPPLPGARSGKLTMSPYFSNASLADPLVLPIDSTKVLCEFPPTLLIGGSRDFSVSSMFHTQAVLSDLGVDAQLHVWDGMWHSFFIDPDLPESQQAYRVIAGFFARHLGRTTRAASHECLDAVR